MKSTDEDGIADLSAIKRSPSFPRFYQITFLNETPFSPKNWTPVNALKVIY
jgi:hypothetical protein